MPFLAAAAAGIGAIWTASTTSSGIITYPYLATTTTSTSSGITSGITWWYSGLEPNRETVQLRTEAPWYAAQRRARNLLLEFLTPLQRETFRDLRHIVVRGASGQRYRIEEGRIGNVALLGPDGQPLHRLCAHPREIVPDADTMLTQLFMLRDPETERQFLERANVH